MTVDAAAIAANRAALLVRIAQAAADAGRDPAAITLVAVSKTQPAAAISAAYAAGQRLFGENRVQEAAEKFPALQAAHPDLRLHLIGALQSNKAARAVSLCDGIATLDRPKLAAVLVQEMTRQKRFLPLLIEVNIGAELQKAGILPAALPAFLSQCRDLGLPIQGLMCIPPQSEDPAPHFTALVRLADTHQLAVRSMGMSGDFETAIRCGSTQVRLGTALFGARLP